MAACKKLFSLYTSSINNINLLLNRNNLVVCHQPCVTLKTRLYEEKLGIPPKPKRPPTAYINFTLQERPKVVKNNPELSAVNVIKILAEKWAKCDPKYKETLNKEYRASMDGYAIRMMDYEHSLTEEQRQLIKSERQRKALSAQKNKMKAKIQDLGRPKRPATPFILFMLSKLRIKSEDTRYSEWMRSISQEWNKLPADKKEKFADESRKLMDQYKSDMIYWEEKMMKMGHVDVVRKQGLVDLKVKFNE